MPVVITTRRRRGLDFLKILAITMVIFYFSYHMVSGDRGLLTLMQLSHQAKQARLESEKIRVEREAIEQRVNRLYLQSLDRDLLDERARESLGQAGKGEVLYLPPRAPGKQ